MTKKKVFALQLKRLTLLYCWVMIPTASPPRPLQHTHLAQDT